MVGVESSLVRLGFLKALRVALAVAVAVMIFRWGGLVAEGAAFVIAFGTERLWRRVTLDRR